MEYPCQMEFRAAVSGAGLGLLFMNACMMGPTKATDALLQQNSTGSVPCAPNEIRILDKSGAQGYDRWTWTLECDGVVYFCAKESYVPAICRAKPPKDAPKPAPAESSSPATPGSKA